jgi:hypothetical protein
VFDPIESALNDEGMQNDDTKPRVHIGRWIWWKCYEVVGGKRARAYEKLGLTWQTIKNYSMVESADELPVDAIPNLEMRLKLPAGHIRAAYLKEPKPPVLVDRRGRRPADSEPKMRVRFSMPRKLVSEIMEYADAENQTLDMVLIEAAEDWVASHQGELVSSGTAPPPQPSDGKRSSSPKRSAPKGRRDPA